MTESILKPVRYLSKSRFKLAHECPTKLYYTGKKDFSNSNDENSFLMALAEGGYQVGELAKLYYPDGTEPNERDYQKAHQITSELIGSNTPVIYEASVTHQNLFARIDILKRTSANSFDLIEVKAKSFDPTEEEPFWNIKAKKKGVKELKAKWEPYLYDIAFQTYIARAAFPNIRFHPYLLLANKSINATVDGLNQLFPVSRSKSGQVIITGPKNISVESLGEKVLLEVDVSEIVDFIINESLNGADGVGFPEYISVLAKGYENDIQFAPVPSSICKKCEFTGGMDGRKSGSRSGFHECWQKAFNTDGRTLDQDLVTDLWNYRGTSECLRSGLFLLKNLPESVINSKESEKVGLSQSERQLLQLTKVKNNDSSLYVDVEALRSEMESWKYPLHFIDFETMTVAIPFHKGQRPYESIAFQFSHHKMQKDGSYHHENEFLFSDVGKFPNFEFVRALKIAIGNCEGTVFRYSPHENSILNQIYQQLLISDASDKAELCAFIESITQKKASKTSKDFERVGSRNMVDLFDILKRY
jgi:hypothetical protein